jgi:hypothetical protein
MRGLIWTAPLAVLVLVACSAEQTALEESHARANVGDCTATVTQSDLGWDSPVPHNTSGHHAHFTVTNTTNLSEAITESCSAIWGITCTGLSPSSPFTLGANAQQDVIATFSTGSTTKFGAVHLTACGILASDSAVRVN